MHVCICSGHKQSIDSKEATFAEVASRESDCNSARRGGDLGPFGRGQMQSKFREGEVILWVVGICMYQHILFRIHVCTRMPDKMQIPGGKWVWFSYMWACSGWKL